MHINGSNGHNGHANGITTNGRDAGSARETRVRPCQKGTWCKEADGHKGDCIEIPREPKPRPAWDLATPDPTGWRKINGQ